MTRMRVIPWILSAVLSISVRVASAAPTDFIAWIHALPRQFAQTSASDRAFTDRALTTAKILLSLRSESLEPSVTAIKSRRDGLILDLWRTRLAVHHEIQSLYARNAFTEVAANAARELLGALRFTEEYLLISFPQELDLTPRLMGQAPILVTNPKFFAPASLVVRPEAILRSGDVLISRGSRSVSATIARLPARQGQFSHAFIVYQDKQTQRFWIVESLIESGAVINPLESLIKHQHPARIVIYRYPDPAVADRAARQIYERVKQAQDQGKPIRYGFNGDVTAPNTLFCTQLIQVAFQSANPAVVLPLFPTRLNLAANEVLHGLGIRVGSTFEPADLEVEPRLDVVAEWRDAAQLRSIQHLDAGLTQAFEWMTQNRYDYDPPLKAQVARLLARPVRWLGGYKDKMPTYIPLKTVETVAAVDFIVQKLESAIAEIEIQRRKLGHTLEMTVQDVRDELEALGPEMLR